MKRQSILTALLLTTAIFAVQVDLARGVSVQVTVDSLSQPWDPVLNSAFPYGINDGIGPTIIDSSSGILFEPGSQITLTYETGLVSAGGPFSDVDADGGVEGMYSYYRNDLLGSSGEYFPSKYMSSDWDTNLMALVGTFADASGQIVGNPFEVGVGPIVRTVPEGATQLQLGINDDIFYDNTGYFDVLVEGSPNQWLFTKEMYPDADKTGLDDGAMCWAATASNILWQQGWGRAARNPDGSRKFFDESDIFEDFKQHWDNVGGDVNRAIDWFITGDADGNPANHGGGGFFPGIGSAPTWQVNEGFADSLQQNLDSGTPVAICISQGGGLNHVFSAWEYSSDIGGLMDYVLTSDSDDDEHRNVWRDIFLNYKNGGRLEIEGYDLAWLPPYITASYPIYCLQGVDRYSGQVLLENADFSTGAFDGWVTRGAGFVEVIEDPTSPYNYVAELTAGSPVSLSRTLDTPGGPYCLQFNFLFETVTGTLDVLLHGVLLDSLVAPANIEEQMFSYEIIIDDERLIGLSGAELTFYLNGLTGSQILLDEVFVTTLVPEPPTSVILVLSSLLLAGSRNRKGVS